MYRPLGGRFLLPVLLLFLASCTSTTYAFLEPWGCAFGLNAGAASRSGSGSRSRIFLRSAAGAERSHPASTFGFGLGRVGGLRGGGGLLEQRVRSTILLGRMDSSSEEPSQAQESFGNQVSARAWVALFVLMLVYASNQASRYLLTYVVNFDASNAGAAKEFMNVDLGFDETGYSILASFGFTLLYSVLSLVAGSTVDRVSRKAATVVSCFAWSAATAAQGLAGSFTDVLMVRVAQGSAQAFTTPAAYTLLSDLFPEEARATANSLYSSGVYFGGALASLCVLLDTQVGWRDSSFAVGGAGIVVALLAALLVPEPPRGALKMAAIQEESSSTIEKRKNEVEEADSFWESAKLVLSSETARLVYASTAVRFSAGFGIGLWSAPYFRAAFPDFAVQYSVTNAFVVASGGFLSSLLGGYLSDRFTPVDVRARAWVPMAGSMLAAPMWAAVMLSGSFYGAMGCLFVEYLVAECWFGPTVAILQGAVPASVRGTAQGGFAMLAAAGNVAPVIIGALQSSYPLHDVLLWMIPSLYLASAGLFYLTGESVKRDEDTRLQILEKEK